VDLENFKKTTVSIQSSAVTWTTTEHVLGLE